jgi:hypothetical protein
LSIDVTPPFVVKWVNERRKMNVIY